jgi:DNA gyrase subunit A
VIDDDEIMMITNGGKIIRTNMQNVRVIGRNTQGVNLFRLGEGEKVVGMDRVAEPSGDVDEESNEGDITTEN